MAMRAKMSILGLYKYDPTIFDGLKLPEEETDKTTGIVAVAVDKEAFINSLLLELADLEVLYPNSDIMKAAIKIWSESHILEWRRLNLSLHLKYNPIYNYERFEEHESNDETESEATNERSGSIENSSSTKTAGFNSETLVSNGASEDSGTSTQNGKANSKDIKKTTFNSKIYGNIGVTTADQMITDFRKTVQFNLYEHIINQFKERFCIMVY